MMGRFLSLGCSVCSSQIRETLLGQRLFWSRSFNVLDKLKFADLGDCPVVPIDQAKTYEKIENHFSQILGYGKRFIALGGDHSTTLPLLRAAHKKAGQPLNLIHFDCYLDTYPPAWGCEYHHGAFLRHAVEEGLVDPKNTMQIGIRGPLAGGDDLDFVKNAGLKVTTVDDVRIEGSESFIAGLPSFQNGFDLHQL